MQEIHVTLLLGLAGLLGTAVTAFLSYKAGMRQTDKDEKIAEDTNGIELIKEAFAISGKLQEALKTDIDNLRQQVKDTQTMVNLLIDENKKLLLENDKLMRANHQLTEENNMLLRENKALSEQILTVTDRMQTLEKAIHATPSVLEEIKQA